MEKKDKKNGGWGLNLCRAGLALTVLYFVAAAVWPTLASVTVRGNWLTLSSAMILVGLALTVKGK